MFNVSGPGMQGMVGMASRVFSAMSNAGVSVILITQSSSEYSISFCVPAKSVEVAKQALEKEFEQELKANDLEPIDVIRDLSIISVVGDGMKQAKGLPHVSSLHLPKRTSVLLLLHRVPLSVQFLPWLH